MPRRLHERAWSIPLSKINAPGLVFMTDPQNIASLARAGESRILQDVGLAPADDGTDGMLYVARKPGPLEKHPRRGTTF